MSDAEEQSKGFKITDRRSFTRDGEPIARADRESEDSAQSVKDAQPVNAIKAFNETNEMPNSARLSTERDAERRARGKNGDLEAGFLDLLSFLATQASLALGTPHPMTGETHEDLEMARVMLSMIEVLGDKTKGNLAPDEQAAIDEIIYQLRMEFMVKAKVIKT